MYLANNDLIKKSEVWSYGKPKDITIRAQQNIRFDDSDGC